MIVVKLLDIATTAFDVEIIFKSISGGTRVVLDQCILKGFWNEPRKVGGIAVRGPFPRRDGGHRKFRHTK